MFRIFLLLAALCAAVLSPVAPVQAQVTTGAAYSGLSIINNIIRNTPGITTISTAGATSVSAAGTATVRTAGGLVIPVAETATASIGAARLAGLAAGALKLGSGIGLAATLAPWILEQSGYKICPPPDFFCKPGQPTPVDPTTSGTGFYGHVADGSQDVFAGTPQGACDKGYQVSNQSTKNAYGPWTFTKPGGNSWDYGKCVANGVNLMNVDYKAPTCPSGTITTTQADGTKTCTVPGADVPVPQSEVQTIVQNKASGDGNAQKQLYDSVAQTGAALWTGSEPVSVSAPQATSQPQTTTEQIDNGDGTTSTKTTTKQATVTPTVTGTTINDTKITYPTTITTTTTITNNTTNVSTTNVTKTTENANPDQSPTQDLPTDYARQNTLQEIQRELSSDGTPVMADQAAAVSSATASANSSLQTMRDNAQNGQDSDKGLFYRFLWTPPVGTCAPYTVTFRSWSGTIDFCDKVALIRDVLGWLMALGTAVRVYQLMFKQGD